MYNIIDTMDSHRWTENSERLRLKLRAGDIVEVRTFDEIAYSLGDDGTMEGLPFQPEMAKYCGGIFRVLRPVKKLVVENASTGLRGIRNIVLLNGVNCDGRFHDNCNRNCFILWKEAWLKRPWTRQLPSDPPFDFSNTSQPTHNQVPLPLAGYCQSITLLKATYPLPGWNLKQYIWDITDNTLPILKRVILLLISISRHIKKSINVQLPNMLSGPLEKTPSIDFDVQPGHWVEVKSLDEIRATLDDSGRNRGLAFTKEMKKFCGQKFCVLRNVDQIIIEGTGETRKLSHTVILKDANCDGFAHFLCSRNCYLLWRKIWLKKV